MSGNLSHTPAQVIRQLLIDLAVGTDITDAAAWPIYGSLHPDTPDNSIAVTDTPGRVNGRSQIDGEVTEHHGVQVRIRGITHEVGYVRANLIKNAIDKESTRAQVVIGTSTYTVHAITRVGDVIAMGPESPSSRRRLFSINAVVALRMQGV